MAFSKLLARLFGVIWMLVALSGFALPVLGKPAVDLGKEPSRYAFVVGNSEYRPNGSSFDDLNSSCDEALAFRQALLDLGWSPENIYPHVDAPAPGESAAHAVRKAVCELTNATLQRKLTTYINMLMGLDSNPYGVVYYAGHGAEAAGDYYAFGVDADVDFNKEVEYIRDHPKYEIFSHNKDPDSEVGSAVNITHIVARMDGPNSKALLLIIDGCRNNAVLDDFIKKHGEQDLPIKYVNSLDVYNSALMSTFILYSAPSKKPAEDAGEGASTRFSNLLLRFLKSPAHLREGAPDFVSSFRRSSMQEQKRLEPYEQQIPQAVGSMASTPIFCFKGCPQSPGAFSDASMELIESTPAAAINPTAQANPIRPVASARTRRSEPLQIAIGYGSRFSSNNDLRRQAVWRRAALAPNVFYVGQSAIQVGAPAGRDSIAPVRRQDSATPPKGKPMYFDVYYCSGDSLEQTRKSAAAAFARSTRDRIPAAEVIAGYSLQYVRLRELNPAVNLAYARPKREVSLGFPAAGSAGKAWATRLGAEMTAKSDTTLSDHVVRAYFCEGFALTEPPSTVYTQVSRTNEKAKAVEIVSTLRGQVHGLNFVGTVEAVDDHYTDKIRTPETSQVRYFLPSQRNDAEQIVRSLSTILSERVEAVRVPGPQTQMKQNPVIEIWFGRKETVKWQAGGGGQPPSGPSN